MKNLFKFGFFALAISLSVVACNSNTSSDNAADTIDSTSNVLVDSIDSASDAQTDTIDSVSDVKVDSLEN